MCALCRAAIAAAKLGKKAAVVERRNMVGGVCINTGTIPSKTLREAVLYLTGLNMRELYGQNYRVKDDITVQDLLSRTQVETSPRVRYGRSDGSTRSGASATRRCVPSSPELDTSARFRPDRKSVV